jgi:hypothetical protein
MVACDVLTGAGYVDVNTPLAPDKVRFEPYAGWSSDEGGISIALPARSVTWITLGSERSIP